MNATARVAILRMTAMLLFEASLGACALLGSGGGFDPAGTWDFTTNYQGEMLDGTITLSRAEGEGAWTCSILTSMAEEVWTGTAAVGDRTATMSFDTGQDIVSVVLEFPADDTLTGTWTVGNTSGRLTGTRRG